MPTSGPSPTRLHHSASQVPSNIPELSARGICLMCVSQQCSLLLVVQAANRQRAGRPAWKGQRPCRGRRTSSNATGLGLSTTCLKRSLPAAKRAMQKEWLGRALVRLPDLLDPEVRGTLWAEAHSKLLLALLLLCNNSSGGKGLVHRRGLLCADMQLQPAVPAMLIAAPPGFSGCGWYVRFPQHVAVTSSACVRYNQCMCAAQQLVHVHCANIVIGPPRHRMAAMLHGMACRACKPGPSIFSKMGLCRGIVADPACTICFGGIANQLTSRSHCLT